MAILMFLFVSSADGVGLVDLDRRGIRGASAERMTDITPDACGS